MVDLLVYLSSIDPTFFIIVIILIFVLQTPIVTFPIYILMIYTGFRLGAIQGTIVSYIGMLLSFVLGYYVGYWSSSDVSEGPKRRNRYFAKFNNWIDKHGLKAVIFLRLVPLLPNNVVSLGSGLSRLDIRPYTIYSGIFIIPWCILWSVLGSVFARTILDGVHINITIYTVIGVVLVVLLLVSFKIYQQRRARRVKTANEEPNKS